MANTEKAEEIKLSLLQLNLDYGFQDQIELIKIITSFCINATYGNFCFYKDTFI